MSNTGDTIKAYKAVSYGITLVGMLTENHIKDFPYMEGENMATLLPDKICKMKGIPPGLLFINPSN